MISYATRHVLLRKPLFVQHSSSQNHTSTSTGLSSTQVRWNCTERCRGEHWPNPCYTNMLTCKPHPTPVHFTKESTLWGSSQWLALQPSSSGPSSICTHCWIVCFSLPLAPVTTDVEWSADCTFWVADEGFVEAALEKDWLDMCRCCYSENKFSKRTKSVLLIPTTHHYYGSIWHQQWCCYNQGADSGIGKRAPMHGN